MWSDGDFILYYIIEANNTLYLKVIVREDPIELAIFINGWRLYMVDPLVIVSNETQVLYWSRKRRKKEIVESGRSR